MTSRRATPPLPTTPTPGVVLASRPAAADALVVAVSGTRTSATLLGHPALRRQDAAAISSALTAVGAPGRAEAVTRLPAPSGLKARMVAAVGIGDGDPFAPETLRRAAGAAVRALAGAAGTVALALPAVDPVTVEAVATGALLGGYEFVGLRGVGPHGTSSDRPMPVERLQLLVDAPKDKALRAAVEHARVVADAVTLTRDLVNLPPSHLPPAALADAFAAAAAGIKVDVEVLDEAALAAQGYGALLAVGGGSASPPRLVRVAYTPRGARRSLALVGKGITFDSGGISLKPPAGMDAMKSDMAGAAAVVAAVLAVARLGLPVAVTAWAALAENLPSGTAQRPSDVITIRGGTTVEVKDTDAEGRLVLADALVRAGEDAPDAVVDVATLTGAQVVALGRRVTAVMSNDDAWREAVTAAAERTGDAAWPMPLPAELRASLDSEVADLANIGERMGGMLVAGLFLREFVAEGTPWAHLDIAGPAYNTGEAYGFTPSGGTGAAVRTLVALAEDVAAGRVLG